MARHVQQHRISCLCDLLLARKNHGRWTMNANSEITEHVQRVTPWFLAGIILLGLALRLYRLDGNSLWVDEIVTQTLVQHDLFTMLMRIIAYDVHPPLFYLLEAQARSLWGNSEFGVRFLSALAGTATIPAIFVFGRALWGRAAALLTAMFIAVSPFFLRYAQEGRMYSLAIFLLVLAFYWLHRAKQSGKKRHWMGFVIAATLAFYTHYVAIILLTLAVLTVALFELWGLWRATSDLEKREKKVRLFLAGASYMACTLLFSPWIGVLALQASTFSKHLAAHQAMPSYVNSFFKISEMVFLSLSRRRMWERFLLFSLWVVGLFFAWRRKRWLPLALGGVPFWGTILILTLQVPPEMIFPHRVSLLVVPWLIWVMGGFAFLTEWIGRIFPRRFAHPVFLLGCLLAAIMVFEGGYVSAYYHWQKEDWRGLAQYLQQHHLTGGVILADGIFAWGGGDGLRVKQGLSYYLDSDTTIVTADVNTLSTLLQVNNGPVLGVIWYQGRLLDCDGHVHTTEFTNLRLLQLDRSTGSVIEDACQILEAMLCMQPFEAAKLDLHKALARIYLATDQPERGYMHLAVLQRTSPEDYAMLRQEADVNRFSWMLATARAAAAQGDMAEADQLFSQLSAMADGDEQRIRVLMAWGISHRFYGSPERAEELFLQVLAIDPGFTEARANYAATLFQQQNYQEALSQFKIVLSQAPDHFWAYYYSGLAYAKLDERDLAREMLLKAMAHAPDDNAYRFARKALEELE